MGDSRRRLVVIGLDSGSPDYLFGRCRGVMPNLGRLLGSGIRAPLRTTDPPISVPAWPVMFAGVDPGSLGLYGFRHRVDHSYTTTRGPVPGDLPVPTFWSLLSDRQRRVCVVGMPLGYPPPSVNGIYVSDFLTPAGSKDVSHPAGLMADLESRYGRYVFDVTFRAEEREQLYRDIVRMTQVRWAVAEDLYLREPWDVFAIHEIGTDRLHHAYTKYFDPDHQGYVAGNRFEHCLLDYYRVLDQGIGRLLVHCDSNTTVCVVSDHGSMPMVGCFCVNQWLAERGYLALGPVTVPGTSLEAAPVDWSRTRAWGAGGYYARIFLNVKGREPQGVVDPAGVPSLRRELERDLASIRRPDGRPFPTQVLDPPGVYHEVRGEPPDLMVYFDDLRWRSAGTVGHPSLFLRENDIGPDDAVHAMEGVFLLSDPRVEGEHVLPSQRILDVMPTLLALLGEPLPSHLQGAPIRAVLERVWGKNAPSPSLATAPGRAPDPVRS